MILMRYCKVTRTYKIPEFHKVYTDGVLRVFLGGPETIPELLQDDGGNVFHIFGLGPR